MDGGGRREEGYGRRAEGGGLKEEGYGRRDEGKVMREEGHGIRKVIRNEGCGMKIKMMDL